MITPIAPTPIPAPTSGRPEYRPGELVDYIAQNGDTLPALAARFNTTVEEIMEANPIIPREATTMPPGLPVAQGSKTRALHRPCGFVGKLTDQPITSLVSG